MKKTACLLLLICFLPLRATAFESTAYTFSTDGAQLRVVQDAYLPEGMYQRLGLKSPQSLYVKGYVMYIADTGNRRVLIVDLKTGSVRELNAAFKQPVCVTADDEGRVYVADYKANCAYRFSAAGDMEQTFEKPDSPAYGRDHLFKPQSVVPDGTGGIYAVVDGAKNGIVQMNAHGQFLGFFASNSAYIAFKYRLYDLVLNDEQMAAYGLGIPGKYKLVLFGDDHLVYALQSNAEVRLQKLSYVGVDLFGGNKKMPALANPVALAMGPDGSIFVLHQTGYVTQLTRDGVLLYRFGGAMLSMPQEGLLQTPSGIGVDQDGKVYVLDKGTGSIHVYAPTAAHLLTRSAIENYYDGLYSSAGEELDKVLAYNSHSYYARLYRGKTFMHMGDYRAAAEQFRMVGEREEYSDAFWEIRNEFLMRNGLWILMALLALCALALLKGFLLPGTKQPYNTYLQSRPLPRPLSGLLPRYLWRNVAHPVDTAYEIKCGHMGGYAYSSILLIAFVGGLTARKLLSGFLYSVDVEEFPVLLYVGGIAALMALFIVSHYFVTSIFDGEATLRMIADALACALTPAVLVMPMLTLICNALTYQELLIVQTLTAALYLLCFVNLSAMLMEIHHYSLRQYLRSLVLTALFMALFVLVISLVYLMTKQLVEFFIQIFTEVNIRE